MTATLSSEFVALRPRCICLCWGARCKFCRVWVSKHDFTPEDAIASAEAAPHHECKPPLSRRESR